MNGNSEFSQVQENTVSVKDSPVVFTSDEMQKITDFFSLLVKIDQKGKENAKKCTTRASTTAHKSNEMLRK